MTLGGGGDLVSCDTDAVRLKLGEDFATVNYWLGLNKIAGETFTTTGDHNIVRPDDEVTTDAEDAGWRVVQGLLRTLVLR